MRIVRSSSSGAWLRGNRSMYPASGFSVPVAILLVLRLSVAGGALQFDTRMIKVRCCAGADQRACEYLPVGTNICPAGSYIDHERKGWECTAHDACTKLMQALEMMNHGQINSEACYRSLREAHQLMKVDTCGRPTVEGVGRKCASAVRANLAVAVLMNERDFEAMKRSDPQLVDLTARPHYSPPLLSFSSDPKWTPSPVLTGC